MGSIQETPAAVQPLDAERGIPELERMQIDQLHEVVLQLSKNCFEIKKLCLTVLVSALVIISGFTSRQLDLSVFLGAAAVVAFFYLLDAQSYYYQRKIRLRMRDLVSNGRPGVVCIGMPVGQTSTAKRDVAWRALFNASMLFYVVLVVCDAILLLLYLNGFLSSFPAAN